MQLTTTDTDTECTFNFCSSANINNFIPLLVPVKVQTWNYSLQSQFSHRIWTIFQKKIYANNGGHFKIVSIKIKN